jgi:hypothetical protein
MSFPDTRNAASPVHRRSFLARAAAAIAAGFAVGNVFRLPAILSAKTTDADAHVTVRPHPHAVPRNNARPSSHE